MKNRIQQLVMALVVSLMLSSCYSYSHTVGQGPQSGVQVKKMNHYLIYGLAPVGVSNPKEMAGDAEHYEVTTEHTFVDGLLAAITFGLYTPTTTVVRK